MTTLSSKINNCKIDEITFNMKHYHFVKEYLEKHLTHEVKYNIQIDSCLCLKSYEDEFKNIIALDDKRIKSILVNYHFRHEYIKKPDF